MDDKLRKIAENHFDGPDCAKNCVEVNILRAKLNNAFMITSLLLGSLLTLNGVIFMKVNSMDTTVMSRMTAIETRATSLERRAGEDEGQLKTITGWHLTPGQDRHK